MEFLAKPHKIWCSERLEDNRAVLKLTFSDRLAYVQNERFRTEKTTLPFKVLAEFSGGKNRMVRPRGFTEIEISIQPGLLLKKYPQSYPFLINAAPVFWGNSLT
jgi:hypothetical protein